jgi:hypothetical protein
MLTQVAWERGFWRDGMTLAGRKEVANPMPAVDGQPAADGQPGGGDVDDADHLADVPGHFNQDTFMARMERALESTSVTRVLRACKDYATAPSALQEVVQRRGHIFVLSPKCHPELAGSE